jgi:hypothetical protein
MGPKIVLTAATIALGFLVVSEQSVVQAAVAADTARCRPLPKRNRLPHASGSRTRSHAPSLDVIPFHPVASRKWAGWKPDRLRYCRLSAPASPLNSGVNFRRFRG